MKFNALISSASLTAIIISLTGASAFAQITIQSTGTLSGTIQLPSINPNFNNIVTRVDTDSTGAYSRNIGSKNNPTFEFVYKSNYVNVKTRSDGSLSYFVDFKGIPVISSNGAIASPVLTGGQLAAYSYQGKIPGTKFQGIVQDEFGLARAFYTGIVTDPATGKQYQGTFQLSGQGPRYSDRNGGASPTVFDFKSDIPGKPSVTSLTMTNVPLVRLTIQVPSSATLVTPGGNNNNPTPSPIDNADSVISAFGSTAPTDNSNSSLLSATRNINLTNGNTFAVNPVVVDPSLLATDVCSRDAVNCPNKANVSPQVIGPCSRVLLHQ